MKKIFTYILVTIMILLLIACSTNDENQNSVRQSSNQIAHTEEKENKESAEEGGMDISESENAEEVGMDISESENTEEGDIDISESENAEEVGMDISESENAEEVGMDIPESESTKEGNTDISVSENPVETKGSEYSESNDIVDESNSNILIAYFSRVGITNISDDIDAVSSVSLNVGENGLIGNTEIIANIIHKETNGKVFQIITVDTYPELYSDTVDQAEEEQKDNARPKLATHVENMDDYDVIFLGYPNWWGTIPMPVYTFLEEYDFSGKTIIPFCTHDGSAMGSSEKDITILCPGAILLDGLAIRARNVNSNDARESVIHWCSIQE